MPRTSHLLLTLVLFVSAPLSADYRDVEVPKSGTIEGYVRFPGETPHPFMFVNRDDHDCPHGIGQNHLLVKQVSLGLQNALVVLQIERGAARKIKQASVTTKGCTLHPRIQVAAQNTNLALRNEDGAKHHLRGTMNDDEATRFDVDLPDQQKVMRRPLVDAGLYRIDCDRHPWERAWIFSTEHPYAVLTDAEGFFSIENVPPGRYEIRAWHEGWVAKDEEFAKKPNFRDVGQTLEVVVKAKKTTRITFDQMRQIPHPKPGD